MHYETEEKNIFKNERNGRIKFKKKKERKERKTIKTRKYKSSNYKDGICAVAIAVAAAWPHISFLDCYV